MRKPIKHIRHHAKKHEKAHLKLKLLLKKNNITDGALSIFISTFIIAISTIIIFFNWGKINMFFGGEAKKSVIIEVEEESLLSEVRGFQSGILANYRINGQAANEYMRTIRQIPTNGFEKGVEAVSYIGSIQEGGKKANNDALINSVFLSTDLSKGAHLTSIRDNGALILQKSILATYYLGEKTVNINSSIQTDSKLLSKINNALSVDIFAYLNQSNDRATSLDNYLNLLKILQEKAQKRSSELQSQINFLNANFEAQERSIELTQEAFFKNIGIFEGENAEKELARFIGLEKEQSEVRAKMGAYKGLKDYYENFLPLLDNLVTAIRANRDPLIAGVKVVEIQNMTLPLIIRRAN